MLLLFEALLFLFGMVGERFPRRPALAGLLLALWVGLGVRNQVTLAHEVRSYPPNWAAYFRAAEWIRVHTPPDVLIVDRKASMLAYATGRRAINFPREEDPSRMIGWMKDEGVDLVVVPSLPYDDIMRYLQPAILAEQYHFAPAFEIEDPYTIVLRFLSEPIVPPPG
jgi:hypothetical protein